MSRKKDISAKVEVKNKEKRHKTKIQGNRGQSQKNSL